jgi:cytidyltransferase-like protein
MKQSEHSFVTHFDDSNDDDSNSQHSQSIHDDVAPGLQRSASLPAIWIDGRADKVYTIGCFDLFHQGHRLLLQRMKQFGREVIVGVHDSRSIFKLKARVPVHGTETRMINVKAYADQVYCVAGTDPSAYVTCIVHLNENQTALYVRGDDMADFPSKHVVEELMPVKFLPYTNGISTTQLRQELFSHIPNDDLEHLEKVN